MIKSNEKVAIGWIDGGNVYSGFAAYISTILINRSDIVSDVVVSSGPYLSLNRNNMVQQFLQTDAKWLLSVDSDICITVEDFDKLINAADEMDRPVVAGKYYLPFDDGRTIIVSGQKFNPDGPEPSAWLSAEDLNAPVIDGLHSVGIGYCLIHRSVFESIGIVNNNRPLSWFQDEYVENERWQSWLSDDVYFWNQVREMGINIALCTEATSHHLKSFKLNDATYLSVNNMTARHFHPPKKISWWAKKKKDAM